jgi:hypothetical protein
MPGLIPSRGFGGLLGFGLLGGFLIGGLLMVFSFS